MGGKRAFRKENPRTYATTGGFQLHLPTGVGKGMGTIRLLANYRPWR